MASQPSPSDLSIAIGADFMSPPQRASAPTVLAEAGQPGDWAFKYDFTAQQLSLRTRTFTVDPANQGKLALQEQVSLIDKAGLDQLLQWLGMVKSSLDKAGVK